MEKDNSRACCNCANATIAYPNCYCWQHKYCNGDRPYEIPKDLWEETAKDCKDFELDTPEEQDVYLELHRIMSEERKPTCKDCDFYDNDCPFVRGRFVPYPEKICKDYTCSRVKEQSQEFEIAVNSAAEKYTDNPDNYAVWTEHFGDFATIDDIDLIKRAFKAGVAWATRYNKKEE